MWSCACCAQRTWSRSYRWKASMALSAQSLLMNALFKTALAKSGCRPSSCGISIPAVLWRWQKNGKQRSEEHTSELQSRFDLVCRLLLEKKKKIIQQMNNAQA